jgi:hypothetical protein
MSMYRELVTATTGSGGDAEAYSSTVKGNVLAVRYAKTDYANGVDFTITTETTAQNIWVDTNVNASENVYPRALCQGTDGANLTGEYCLVPVAGERIKIVIAQGGDTTSGTFTFVIHEPDFRKT